MTISFTKKIAGAVVLAAVTFGAGATSHVQAATDVILQSPYQQTTNINQGQTNTFHAVIQNNTGAERRVLVDLELHNSSGQRVAQQVYDNVLIRPYNIVDLTLRSPSNLPPGTYTWKVGIYFPGWNGQIAWYENALTFQVNNPSGTSTTTGDVLLNSAVLGSARFNNCPPLTAVLSNTSPNARNVLVDIELRRNNGELVDQYYVNNFTVPSALSRTLSAVTNQCTRRLEAGTYNYSVGIFNPGWNGVLHWYSNVRSFTVQATST
jgi:hypothetical protein